jgi:hypothetical protein
MLVAERFSEDMIDRTAAFGFSSEHQRRSETYFFEFLRTHAMSGDVVDSVLRPENFSDHVCDSGSTLNSFATSVRQRVA